MVVMLCYTCAIIQSGGVPLSAAKCYSLTWYAWKNF